MQEEFGKSGFYSPGYMKEEEPFGATRAECLQPRINTESFADNGHEIIGRGLSFSFFLFLLRSWRALSTLK